MSVEILSTAAQLYVKSHLKRIAICEWPWRWLELPLFNRPCHVLLMVSSNSVSILHSFRDICTCTVHMTACDLRSSSVSIQHNKPCALSTLCALAVETCLFPQEWTAKSDLQCHSRSTGIGIILLGNIQFPITLPLQHYLFLVLCPRYH